MDSFSLKWRRGRASRHLFKYLILPTTRKTVSPIKMSNFKLSKLTSHKVYKKLVLTIFTEPIMHPVYSQKFCITIVFDGYVKFWGVDKVHWSWWKWWMRYLKQCSQARGSTSWSLPSPRAVICSVKVIWASPNTLVISWSLGQARRCNSFSLEPQH